MNKVIDIILKYGLEHLKSHKFKKFLKGFLFYFFKTTNNSLAP